MSDPTAPLTRKPDCLLTPGRSCASRFELLDRSPQCVRERVLQFLTAEIRSPLTRDAYARAIGAFLTWSADHGITDLSRVTPVQVAAYVEELQHSRSRPTVKRALAAIRRFFDSLVVVGHVPHNPAAPVRGPRHIVTRGTTPVLTGEETRHLLDSISTSTKLNLRDRALIGLMVYTFARVTAAVSMHVEDYFAQGKRWFVRLHEKNGRLHQVPVHSQLEPMLDAYVRAAGLESQPASPLFRSANPSGGLTHRPLSRHDAFRVVRRRAVAAGLSETTCCHTFRATGITSYLLNGGTLDHAQEIAGHASARTTSLYDRRTDSVAASEIERIRL